jgi:hypothetical protein
MSILYRVAEKNMKRSLGTPSMYPGPINAKLVGLVNLDGRSILLADERSSQFLFGSIESCGFSL